MAYAIETRGVTKQYVEGEASTLALAGVDLTVSRGEVVLLMGPSGSGKTTMLSIMGCILRPTAGQVILEGRDVTAMSEKDLPAMRLKHIGFVFQGFNLFPTLSVGENIELSLSLKGVRGRDAKKEAQRLLDLVGIGNKYKAFPADISGGQKQRVAIARAVAGSPVAILADEPTAALDSHTGKAVVEMMAQLAHQQNRAVVIVTHDGRLAEYADRIVWMEDGVLAQVPDRTTDTTHFHATEPAEWTQQPDPAQNAAPTF
jgi:putative ABC transport system ATP-binding protein